MSIEVTEKMVRVICRSNCFINVDKFSKHKYCAFVDFNVDGTIVHLHHSWGKGFTSKNKESWNIVTYTDDGLIDVKLSTKSITQAIRFIKYIKAIKGL